MTVITTPPTPRTKRPTRKDAAVAPSATAPDLEAIAREAMALDADYAHQEAQIAAQLREIVEKRQQARAAQEILLRQTQSERRAAEAQARESERADQQAAYEADVATRQRLFARIQALTDELAPLVREAIAVDQRIYSASLALGLSPQRSGYAKRAIQDAVGTALNIAGLRDFPRSARPNPTLVTN